MDGSYHTGAGGVDRAGNLGGPPARPGRKTPHISANRAFPSNQAVRVDGVYIRVRRAQIVDALVYSQILIAAQNPSGQIFAASEKPRRDLVPESNMLFIGAAASRGTSGLMVNVPTLTRVGVKWTPGLRARGSMHGLRLKPAP